MHGTVSFFWWDRFFFERADVIHLGVEIVYSKYYCIRYRVLFDKNVQAIQYSVPLVLRNAVSLTKDERWSKLEVGALV